MVPKEMWNQKVPIGAQIYRGKAHKCIITDLMPRTTFRLRVAPILHVEMILKPSQNVDEDDPEP